MRTEFSVLLVLWMWLAFGIQLAGASTASLHAQQLPLELLRDEGSVALFPSSALRFEPGLYLDLEGARAQLGLASWGDSRLGLSYVADEDVLDGRSMDLLWAFPVAGVDAGLAVQGWRTHSLRETGSSTSRSERQEEADRYSATMGMGVKIGRRGYLDVAISAGEFREEQRDQRWTLREDALALHSGHQTTADADASWAVAMRFAFGDPGRGQWVGYIGHVACHFSACGEWITSEGEAERRDLPRETTVWKAMLGRRLALSRRVAMTMVLTADYDEVLDSRPYSSSEVLINQTLAYESLCQARWGLEACPRKWLRLYAGLAGGYWYENQRSRRLEPEHSTSQYSQQVREGFDKLQGSVGFGLRTWQVYLDTTVHNDFSTNNPFVHASVGWRF